MNIKKAIAWLFTGYFIFILLLLILIIVNSSSDILDSHTPLPDMSQYEQVDEKKAAFFSLLRPLVQKTNAQILQDRQKLKSIQNTYKKKTRLSSREHRQLAQLRSKYEVDASLPLEEQLSLLDLRIHIVPESLTLAQAAIESAWGNSRFAKEANNLFGQWCFSEGCGLVPRKRPKGAIHEVQKFESLEEAVDGYMNNINTHQAYRPLRLARKKLLEKNMDLSGTELANYLGKYSERGEHYIEEVKIMIKRNDLEPIDSEGGPK